MLKALALLITCLCPYIGAEEPQESLPPLQNWMERDNDLLSDMRKTLQQCYEEVQRLYEEGADNGAYEELFYKIKALKKEIAVKENSFRHQAQKELDDECVGFWDQGEMTLGALISEYGALNYLYIVPNELNAFKLQLHSALPLPKEGWDEMLRLILLHNGIGIKQLTPFLRQLYFMKHDISYIHSICADLQDLEGVEDEEMVFYILSPPVEQLKTFQAFFERFADPKRTTAQIAGNKIILIGTKSNIKNLLQMQSAIWDAKEGKIVKILPLSKLKIEEAEKIVRGFFSEAGFRPRPPIGNQPTEELQIFSLSQTNQLVLIASSSVADRCEELLEDIERQIKDPEEKTIFWYTCKHSDPEEIAQILEKVYHSLASSSLDEKKRENEKNGVVPPSLSNTPPALSSIPQPYKPPLPVSPAASEPGTIQKEKEKQNFANFIVDPKTGSILMVVRKDDLSKIQLLLKRLDVPKKMAQIDVLLVEKKLQDRKQTGISLLKLGGDGEKKEGSISFDTSSSAVKKGILDFILSRPKGKGPAFDFIMSFLMSQDDIRINANPSILAINQTPATISIVEELSINNGAVQVATGSGVSVEKSFTRAQFGITIVLTPTIHLPVEEGEKGFVSLLTNITFDTTQTSQDDRPPVTRRHIENEVRIADGETIILGGLRRLSEEDSREKIPFLGDIPGIGKLFGTTKSNDSSTEMFIFLTPKIIEDPVTDLERARQKSLEKRPGDIPEFLEKVQEAKEQEQKRMFENSLKVLFDS